MMIRCVKQGVLPLGRLLVLVLAALTLSSAHTQPVQASPLPSLARDALLQFTSHGQVLGFQMGGFYVSNGSYALQIQFVGAHAVAPASDSAAAANAFGAPPLTAVTYANLWDGITLTYDASRGLVTSSYRLEPQADVHAIHLRYNAPVTLNADGTLTIAFATGQMTESAPFAWQEVAGERVPVRIAFECRGEREVGFEVGEYDARLPLFIDPALTWNTFLGASWNDDATAVAVDPSGNIYVAGQSHATWGSPIRPYTSGWSDGDVYAAKLSANGELIWNTFLGGGGVDYGGGIGLDRDGNVYVSGMSTFTWGSPLQSPMDFFSPFAAKLSPDGALLWNTFVGKANYILSFGAADENGNVYVSSTSMATWGSPKRPYTNGDVFVAKLDSSGTLLWNTFLGGNGYDDGGLMAVDGNGNIYVAGSSNASWGSPRRAYTSGNDAFVAKLDPNGELIWNTFLGGSGDDAGYALALDSSANVYAAGESRAA